jgi:hypothetical protein
MVALEAFMWILPFRAMSRSVMAMGSTGSDSSIPDHGNTA